jgi:hypothetical protein
MTPKSSKADTIRPTVASFARFSGVCAVVLASFARFCHGTPTG